ncbi:MAG TPA: hypothetical protein QKA14_02600 [Candidatus Megaira endosymbiont of Hartmannula sinica]|nr:hypothetical protein [Candidatus Megaera endosymbiont of Hartmannula sinica]
MKNKLFNSFCNIMKPFILLSLIAVAFISCSNKSNYLSNHESIDNDLDSPPFISELTTEKSDNSLAKQNKK